MAPRPSSPTSLLWAHQLKREHAHLLKRMQNLESASEKQEDRIKSAESAARTPASGNVAALAKEVKALDSTGINKRLSDMEQNVTQKIDDVQAENEAMTMQIAALQKDEKAAEDERRKTLTKDKALLKRIGDVEEGLKKYQQSLDLIGKRINERQFEQIKEQLENLTKQVKQEGSQMKMLTESIAALESANAELSKANQRLETELRTKTSKALASPVQASAKAPVRALGKAPAHTPLQRPAQDTTAGAEATPDTESERPKKKSHKWAGGGADKDIILQGSGFIETSPITVAQPPSRASAAPKQPAPAPRKILVPKKPAPKKKSAVPKVPGPSSDRKSHKWAGGGADRSIIAAGMSQDPVIIKREPVSDDEEEMPPRKKARFTASGKEIIRSGKGWYEVACSPSPEREASGLPAKHGPSKTRQGPATSQDSDIPVKRGRGRPRKYPLPKQESAEPVDHDVAPRRNISQKQDSANSSSMTPEQTRKEPNIFSSPVSSSPPPGQEEQHTSKNVTMGPVYPQPEQARPTARRQIVQDNDDISAIVRQMSS